MKAEFAASRALEFTSQPERLTVDLLNAALHTRHPDASIRDFDILESCRQGEMVSTSARATLTLEYEPGVLHDLSKQVVCKLAISPHSVMAPFYQNEVQIYARLRPDLLIETPDSLGALYDTDSGQFLLLLEDLTQRGARFPNVTQDVTLPSIESLVDSLAILHAAHWESPRFSHDLSWVQTHLDGAVARVMNELAPPLIQHEIDTQSFKREIVQALRTSGSDLLAGVQAVQRHQSRLPQTLLHGDTHLGNTYLLPTGETGLLDWQLSVRGYCMHDLCYLIVTNLPIALRRRCERELLRSYRERLVGLGVKNAPTADQFWNEYRRAVVWGVYIGWLTTPVANYGWEVNVVNHLRLATAYEDLETAGLVKDVMP